MIAVLFKFCPWWNLDSKSNKIENYVNAQSMKDFKWCFIFQEDHIVHVHFVLQFKDHLNWIILRIHIKCLSNIKGVSD